MNQELALCAKINFENLEKARPDVATDPYYRIAKAQLDEALGGMPIEEKFSLDVKRAEKAHKRPECPPHHWDRSGERCVMCGTKDWMT